MRPRPGLSLKLGTLSLTRLELGLIPTEWQLLEGGRRPLAISSRNKNKGGYRDQESFHRIRAESILDERGETLRVDAPTSRRRRNWASGLRSVLLTARLWTRNLDRKCGTFDAVGAMRQCGHN